jgi:hypothetical protein
MDERRERVHEFVDWAMSSGADPTKREHYARFGAELVDTAMGGRITESHILALSDSYAATPGAESALPLIEEIGDAMLRFQDHLRAQGRPVGARPLTPIPVAPIPGENAPPALSEPLPTNRPRRPRPPESADPGLALDPPGAPLRQPRRPESVIAVEPEVVSFSQVEPPPHEPAAVSIKMPLEPLPEVEATPPPRSPPEAAPRVGMTPPTETRRARTPTTPPAAQQFRCPKCKVMVTPTPAGTCPRCGSLPPHIGAFVPDAPRHGGSMKVLLVLAVVAVVLFLATRVLPGLLEKPPEGTEAASGGHRSEHLRLSMSLPSGWRKIVAADLSIPDVAKSEYYGIDDQVGFDPKPITAFNLGELHLSQYIRGKHSPHYQSAMIVGTAPALGQPYWKTNVGTIESLVNFGATAMGKALPASGMFHAPRCDVVSLPAPTGRCVLALDPDYLIAYFWATTVSGTDGYALTLFFGRGSIDEALAEGDAIVSSMSPL